MGLAMNYQNKYRISFGHKGLPDYKTIDVYAFDIRSAIEVALNSLKDEPTIPAITSVELVKEL